MLSIDQCSNVGKTVAERPLKNKLSKIWSAKSEDFDLFVRLATARYAARKQHKNKHFYTICGYDL